MSFYLFISGKLRRKENSFSNAPNIKVSTEKGFFSSIPTVSVDE